MSVTSFTTTAAANGRSVEIISSLDNGQNIDVLHSITNCTALMCASDLGRHAICLLLLKKGANVDAVNPSNGFTSLHYASQSGRVKVIRELLAFKASKHIFTRNGLKPVDLAIEYKHQPIIDILKDCPPQPPPPIFEDRLLTSSEIAFQLRAVAASYYVPAPDTYEAYFCPSVSPILPMTLEEHETMRSALMACLITLQEIAHKRPSRLGRWDDTATNTKGWWPALLENLEALEQSGCRLPDTCRAFGLLPATLYYFAIRLRNIAGWGPFRFVICRTLCAPPGKPLGVKVVATSTSKMEVEWKCPEQLHGLPVLDYELQFCLLPEKEQHLEDDSDEEDFGDTNLRRDAHLMTRPAAYCTKCARFFPRLIIADHGSDCLVCGAEGSLRPGKKPKVDSDDVNNDVEGGKEKKLMKDRSFQF